jgi:hypothetical protein
MKTVERLAALVLPPGPPRTSKYVLRQKWRRSRQQDGLCNDCNNLVQDGKRRCRECNTRNLFRTAEWEKRQRIGAGMMLGGFGTDE